MKTKTSPKVKKTRRKRSKLRVAGIGLETAGLGALGAGYYSHKKGMAASSESKDAGRIAKEFDNAHTKMWRGGVPQTLVRGDKSYVVEDHKKFKAITTKLRTESAMFREIGASSRADSLKHFSKAMRLGKAGMVSGLTGLGASALAGIYGFRKKRQQAKK
jgi:hypothetical protein